MAISAVKLKGFSNPKIEFEQYTVNIAEYLPIYNRAIEICRDKNVVDLCAGTGTFSLPIASAAKSLTFLEADPDVIPILKENCEVLGLTPNIINKKVEDIHLNYDTILCNPPFGVRSKRFKPIIEKINDYVFKDALFLISYTKVAELISTIKFTFVRHFQIVSIKLDKTYEHHTEEFVFTRCVCITLSRSEGTNCQEYEFYLSELGSTSEPQLSEHSVSKVVEVRVGYMIQNVFNGRLACVKNYGGSNTYSFTLENDPTLSQYEETVSVKLKKASKVFLYDPTIPDDAEFGFSTMLKSSLNSTFIILNLLPLKDPTTAAPLTHDVVCLHAAATVLKVCLVVWPNNMSTEDRNQLAVKLLPNIALKTLKEVMFCSDFNLKEACKQVVSLTLRSLCKKIELKREELTVSEISYISREIQEIGEVDYFQFLESKLPSARKVNYQPSLFLNTLSETVDTLKVLIEERAANKAKLEYIKKELAIEQSAFKVRSSQPLDELKGIKFKIDSIIKELTEIVGSSSVECVINEIESNISEYYRRPLPEATVDLMEPGYMRELTQKLREDQEYNRLFKHISASLPPLIKFIGRILGRFDSAEDNKITEVVESYFDKIALRKVFNTSGAIRGVGSISILLNYVYTYLNIMKEKQDLSDEDVVFLEDLCKKMTEISKRTVLEPVQSVIRQVIDNFYSEGKLICESARDEYDSLVNQLKLSSGFNHAWSIALRLKGLMYESYFATSWNLQYIPEDCKHSLLTIIRHTMPFKIDLFIKRTQKHPEIREFKPDFCLVKKPLFTQTCEQHVREEVRPSASEGSTLATDTSISSSKARLFISKGKVLGWSEHENDETIKGYDKNMSEIIGKLIEHGSRSKSKGGIHLGDKTETFFGEDATDDDINIWDEIEIKTKPDKYQLFILEVGYQTDQEGKILSDLQKWKVPINILQSMDIEVVILSAVDRTNMEVSNWWIKEFYVRSLKRTVSKLFSLLTKNSPVDVSEHIIGDIGSQKLRMSLRTGSLVRPPIIGSDLVDYYSQWRQAFMKRPSGVKIPSGFESDFIQANVFGATVRTGLQEVETFFEEVVDRAPDIIEAVKAKHPIHRTSDMTKFNVLIEWTNKELENNKCPQCIKEVKDKIKQWNPRNKLTYMCQVLNSLNSCETCLKQFGQHLDSNKLQSNFLSIKTNSFSKSLEEELVKIKTCDNQEKYTKHPFDKFVSMLLPAKTQKQAKVKKLRKRLIESILIKNEEIAVKDSKGQILVVQRTDFTSRETEICDPTIKGKFSIRSLYTIEEADETIEDDSLDPLTKKINSDFLELEKLMADDYSESHKKIVADVSADYIFNGNEKPRCVISKCWVERIFTSLKIERNTIEHVKSFFSGSTLRQEKAVTNDTFKTIETGSVSIYLDQQFDEGTLINCREFKVDCLLMKELVEQVITELQGTDYYDCVKYVISCFDCLLRFNWFNRVVLYAKICQTFMQVCSEFVHSGIKVKKIQHTSLNLIVKVTENKASNMVCTVVDNDMQEAGYGNFFLNRRSAVLGQSLPYCYSTMFIQYVQMFNCCDGLTQFGYQDIELYKKTYKCKFVLIKDLVLFAKEGHFGDIETLLSGITSRDYDLQNNIDTKTVFIILLATFNLSYGVILGPAMALNSQLINKQIQTIRYPMMLSLSELGFETKLGSKLFCPRRRIEGEVLNLWLKVVTYMNLNDIKSNIAKWKENSNHPDCLYSYSLCGIKIINDRHFVYDIYLVHLYNKELDDFDQGQIRVLDDFAERHFDWEMDLKANIDGYVKLSKRRDKLSNSQKVELSKHKRNVRLLLGIPKLDSKKQGRDCIKLIKSQGNKLQREFTLVTGNNLDETQSTASSSNDSNDSNLNQAEQNGASGTIDSSGTQYRLRSSTGYSIKISSSVEVFQGELTGGQQIAVAKSNSTTYIPSSKTVISDILEVCKRFPKHSFASYEFIQMCTEYAKQYYNEGSLEKSRRSQRNWQSLTSFIETTSIISEPLTDLSLKTAITMIKTQMSKKLTKLLKRRLDHSKDAQGKTEKEVIINYLDECMSEAEFNRMVIEDVKKQSMSGKSIDFINWNQIVHLPIRKTLLSSDANMIYFWIKSLNKDIGSITKANKLRGMQRHTKSIKAIRVKLDKLSKGEPIKLDEEDIQASREAWSHATSEVIRVKKIPKLQSLETQNIIDELNNLWQEYQKLKLNKETFHSATFLTEELELSCKEMKFLKQFEKELPIIFNLILCHVLSSPWIRLLTPSDMNRLHIALFSDIAEEGKQNLGVTLILTTLIDFTESMCQLLVVEDKMGVERLIKYLVSMFHSNEMPFKYVYSQPRPNFNDLGAQNTAEQLEMLRETLAIKTLDSDYSDFFLTIMTMKAKNFAFTKKCLAKSGNDRIPRSTRSKVLFELTKLAQNHKQIILQQVVFSEINNVYHRNYATLAPKAQYGGDRDLLVQETSTKLLNAVSEQWSKSVLDNSNCDALVKPKVKELALDESQALKVKASSIDGTPYSLDGEKNTELVNIYKVFCAAADHTKWGPVHNTSTFNAMDTQLLREHSDWSNFLKLVNIKSLIKQIEIPASSINKILRSMIQTKEFKEHKGFLLVEDELRHLLKKTSEYWAWKPHIKFLIEQYLTKGKNSMNSYNHMGQGIHHAKSSLFGDVVRRALMHICQKWFLIRHPSLTLTMKCFGSSDDLSMIIEITGICQKADKSTIDSKIIKSMEEMLNLWNGLSRAGQMYLSEKSVFSSCVNEMYSDFDLYHRVSPSVIKFTLSTIINSTITTPLTLYQSLHVSCQQACFMSTPFLTNLMFSLCRQSVMLMHSEDFYRKFGCVVFKLPASFGRLYLPKLSITMGGQVELDELDNIKNALILLQYYLKFCTSRALTPVEEPENFRVELKEEEKRKLVESYLLGEGIFSQADKKREDFDSLSSPQEENFIERFDTSVRTRRFLSIKDAFSGGSSPSETADDSPSGSMSIASGPDNSYSSEVVPMFIEDQRLGEITAASSSVSSGPLGETSEDHGMPKIKGSDMFVNELYDTEFCHHRSKVIDEEFIKSIISRFIVKDEFQSFVQALNTSGDLTVKDITAHLCSAILTAVIINYYEFNKSTLGEFSSKSLRSSIQISVEDPFLYILPEKVRVQLSKLNLLKDSLHDPKELVGDSVNVVIARNLIVQNTKTEDYESEMSRIVQIANSRNIHCGLSGGLKDISIPNIRQVLRSYFFLDKTGIVISDHWPTSYDRTVKSDANKIISSNQKVKFYIWISEVLKGSVHKLGTSGESRPKALEIYLQPKLAETAIIKNLERNQEDEPQVYILFDKVAVAGLAHSIENLVGKLIVENKATIRQVENSKVVAVFSAANAAVVKTKLFSNEGRVKFNNNPAVVIGHMLDHISAASCKPINVNYGQLELDKSLMTTHYPEVISIISKVKNGAISSPEDIKRTTSLLSNISRSISDSALSATPLYCFKPFKSKFEDSIATLVNYNVIEGLELKTDENHVRDSAFSENYFRLLECVSLIGSLPVDDSKKTSLLTQFLNWNPAQYSPKIVSEHGEKDCLDSHDELAILSKFNNEPIAIQLLTESRNIKNRDDRRAVTNIANFALDQRQIIVGANRTDLSLHFKPEGVPYEDGRFQLSCEFGTSCGYFYGKSLVVVLSAPSVQLLRVVEGEVLSWCSKIRTTVVTASQHTSFIKLLATNYEAKNLVSRAKPMSVVMRTRESGHNIELVDSINPMSNCVFIKSNILTYHTFKETTSDQAVNIQWGKGYLSMYITNEVDDLVNSTYMKNVILAINNIDKGRNYREFSQFREQKVILSTVKLPISISKPAVYLMHMFLWHKIELHPGISLTRKEQVKQFFRGDKQFTVREMVTKDQTMEIINTYLLSTKRKIELQKIQEAESVLSGMSKGSEFQTSSGGLDESGYYTFDDYSNKVYLDTSTPNYHRTVARLEKENLSLLQTFDDLPDIPSVDIMKELGTTLNQQNYELLVRNAQVEINKKFKDISAWPYIKLLLEELNLGTIQFFPTSNPIDNKLQWKLTKGDILHEIRLGKNVYDALLQVKSGSIPLTMSYLVFIKPNLSEYFSEISHLCNLIANLNFNKKTISANLALVLYLDKPNLESRCFCFNWLDLLSGILPATISSKTNDAVCAIKSRSGELQMTFNIFISSEEAANLSVEARAISDTLTNLPFAQIVPLDTKTVVTYPEIKLIGLESSKFIKSNFNAKELAKIKELANIGESFSNLFEIHKLGKKKQNLRNLELYDKIDFELTIQLRTKELVKLKLNSIISGSRIIRCATKSGVETVTNSKGVNYFLTIDRNSLLSEFRLWEVVSQLFKKTEYNARLLIGLCYLMLKVLLGGALNKSQTEEVNLLLNSRFNPDKQSGREQREKQVNNNAPVEDVILKIMTKENINKAWFRDDSDDSESDNLESEGQLETTADIQNYTDALFDESEDEDFISAGTENYL